MAWAPIDVSRAIHPAGGAASSASDPAGDPGRVFFGRTPVDRLTMAEATAWLLRLLESPQPEPGGAMRLLPAPLLIMGPNAFLVTLAERDERFAAALASAALCLPDGMSVVWGSRLLGRPIPERVPGGDFMEQMCALGAQSGRSIYFLGGLPEAASQAAEVLARRYPGLVIAGTDCPPHGFDRNPLLNQAVLDRIRAARPDLLCVALGAPRQEIWMMDYCRTLPIRAALSVGAAFDTQAGLRRRAPRWTHAIGAEWLYRLVMEPRRLWRRYLIGNLVFGKIVLREFVQRFLHSSGQRPTPRPAVPFELGARAVARLNRKGLRLVRQSPGEQ